MRRTRKFGTLEKRLGYVFRGRDHLARALTHASVRSVKPGQTDNERLEFLGDRVLGLVIAELLTDTFPTASEGDLARRYNRLVRRAACAAVARRLELGEHLILSDSEEGSGGRTKDTILADAIEALLGAVFLEAGFDTSRTVVRALWAPLLDGLPQVPADAKSALQEWAQGGGRDLPRYVEISRSGPDHAPHFVSEVRITGCKPARGEGATKRQAEQAAAAALLDREGVLAGAARD